MRLTCCQAAWLRKCDLNTALTIQAHEDHNHGVLHLHAVTSLLVLHPKRNLTNVKYRFKCEYCTYSDVFTGFPIDSLAHISNMFRVSTCSGCILSPPLISICSCWHHGSISLDNVERIIWPGKFKLTFSPYFYCVINRAMMEVISIKLLSG